MTLIKRLSSKGFKSFANKTDLIFGKGFNIIIGPNGAGKSLSYNSIITLSNGEEIKIGKLVEEKLKNAKEIKKLKDGIYCEESGTYVISVNPLTMKSGKKLVSKFIKREGEELFKIKTRSGKEITATGCHPIMIFKEGILKSILIKDLKSNDFIATPREIKTEANIIFDKEKAKLIGYLIGDGYLGVDRIDLTNEDIEIIDDFKRILNKLYENVNIKEYKKKGTNAKTITTWNKNIISELRNLFYKDYKGSITGEVKKIPDLLLGTSNEVIGQLLAGIYDTDGYVPEDVSYIELSSKNKEFIYQVQRLLLRFDILSHVSKKLKCATNTEAKIKRWYYYLNIYGYENLKRFYINIPLKCNHKKTRLQKIVEKIKNSNPNVDILPQETNYYVRKLVKLLGLKVKNLKKEYPRLVSYYENRCAPSRDGINELLVLFKEKLEVYYEYYENYLRMDQNQLIQGLEILNISGRMASVQIGLNKDTINNFWRSNKFQARKENLKEFFAFIRNALTVRLNLIKDNLQVLYNLASSDLFWDQVLKIEKTEKEAYVYDLTVPENHNFIADGIFAHNSNVVDALCFVLGKSSAREMRAEKSSHLIYNGGKKHSPAKEAEVTIEFDNSTGKFPIQGKEVSVTRIVKQNGTSEYIINNEVRTRQQVLDLLNAAKIDPDGHNIILQGDIIHFMEMKPIERRQVIEEISGISVYEDKKTKCLQELEKVDSKLNEAEIILTEREANLRELKKERDQAIKFKEIQETIKDDKATYLHLQIKEKNEELEDVESRKKEAEEKISKINLQVAEYKNQINNFKEEIKRINEEIEVKGEKDQLVIRKEIEELKTEIVKADSRAEVCTNEITKIKTRKEQLLTNINEIQEKIKELNLKSKQHEAGISNLSSKEKEIEKKIFSLKAKAGVEGEDNTLEKLELETENKQEEINKIIAQKQELLRTKDQVAFKLSILEEKISSMKGSGKDMENLKNYKKEFREAAEKLARNLNEDSSFAAQLSKARYELLQNNEELAKLTTRQLGIQERTMSDLAVRKILELKNSMKGIHGLVSSLGNVDGKYSAALEVAAGQRLNSIVVESDITAQKCIEHLKTNKLGVATFLPLNKIKSRIIEHGVKELLKTKGVHGLAVELVNHDHKYKEIFSYVLGSTLIIDDIETGRRIGIGKARMVTLEGDLLEPSGAMVGGYRIHRTGLGFKEKEIDTNIERLEEEIKKLKTLISHVETKKTDNEVMITSLRERKAELEGNIIKIEKSMNIEGLDVNSLAEEKKELAEALKSADMDIENFDKNIKNLNNYLEKLKEKKSKLREKLKDPEVIRNLETLEQQKLKIKESVLEFRGNIKNAETQVMSMLMPEKEKTEKIIKQQEKENEEFFKELNTVKEIIKRKEADLKSKEAEEKKFYANFKDLVTKRNKYGEKIQNFETNLAREEEKTKGFEQRLNNISIDRAKVIAELEALNKDFENYKEAKIKRGMTFEDLKMKIHENEKLLGSIGNVNLRALEVYENIDKEYQAIVEKVSKLRSEKDDVLNVMAEVEGKKKDIFMKTYKEIVRNFKEIFNSLTTKGEVYVTLENEENPFEGGVDIQVKLVGNRYLDLKSLSGGEKTLCALSFIFAIQEHEPSPFYLLDEVDAALDKKNSELLSKLIQKYSNKAQYLVISHNDHIINEAEYVYGVSMQDGISKVVSLKV
ncbi:MAG TPA: chromosome segregation protein SMC [Candidatus Nanoarchaeia archaeon]|nr:chromosome segregation protein SMC [Candidatus Nanoarchaeia archaeon]